MKQVSIIVEAKKYFEADAEKLDQIQEGDLVLVNIDFENRKADFIWYPAGGNPANFPAEEDDFDAVVNFCRKEIAEAVGE
ncbi:hypothetical protein L1765_11270 [Microaerobacter geothermalis]|uniref:hypothetical protein n=1 Tax=Microaerobacter geothermalis TaxID=674972 RepID=UPI001F2B0114|nr:hypothetical protein [Microaerobacter geothermalis]MCF6094543.1 hypothetical protein [Microaerobacter geothermalis]